MSALLSAFKPKPEVRPTPVCVTAPIKFSVPALAEAVLPVLRTTPVPMLVGAAEPNHPVPKLPVDPLTMFSVELFPSVKVWVSLMTAPN